MKIASTFLFFIGFCFPTFAACNFEGGNFFPDQNDTLEISGKVYGNGVCARVFTSAGIRFETLSVEQPPTNGSILTNGISSFTYTARKGFRGTDTFTMKICAESRAGRGCSRLKYKFIVE